MQKYTTLEEFLGDLNKDKRSQVDVLRELILATEPRLEERIKWNAPSYVFEGEDRITFNLMNKQGLVKLVFHMGTTRKEDKKGAPIMQDATGLLTWSSDIRAMITFNDRDDVIAKRDLVQTIVSNWLTVPVKI